MSTEKTDNRSGLVTTSPHLQTDESIAKIMWSVLVTLLPAWFFGIYWFGIGALFIGILAIAASMATEFVVKRIRGQRNTILDGSAAVAGLLLAFNLPANAPWWMTLIGSIFMIVIVKELFGGLGFNILNPALAARAFLLASWPVQMTGSWVAPSVGTMSGLDAETGATPLTMLKHARDILGNAAEYDPAMVTQAQANIANLSDSYVALMLGNVRRLYRWYFSPGANAWRSVLTLQRLYHLAYPIYFHRHSCSVNLDIWWRKWIF
jgi:electron transport complex protein RnfD